MNRVDNKGFTIVELLLAMTFIAVLLLTIAVTVIHIGNMYNKGLTMRAVDQSGRTVTGDLRRIVGQSQPFNVASDFVQQRHTGSTVAQPDGGRLCTGQYTYVWNYGRTLANGNPINKYDTGSAVIRFVRVLDSGGILCKAESLDTPIRTVDATELLAEGDQNLAVQSFDIDEITRNSAIGQALYRVVLEIGTNDQSAIKQDIALNTIDTSCKPPSDDDSQQDFCAVNQFDFTVQAGNKGGL